MCRPRRVRRSSRLVFGGVLSISKLFFMVFPMVLHVSSIVSRAFFRLAGARVDEGGAGVSRAGWTLSFMLTGRATGVGDGRCGVDVGL